MHVKRVTLTSKKNWWMVELDREEETTNSVNSFSSSEETVVDPLFEYHQPPHHHPHHHHLPLHKHLQHSEQSEDDSPPPSPIYNPPRHPTSIFSFPTPTAYCAPPNPTGSLDPCAHGSASELFKCVVKKPDVVQLEINGEMQSNANDVTVQFLAELRVYTTLSRHRNICAFLGSLENVGLVLEYIDGRTLYDVIKSTPTLTQEKKVVFHNQLLDGLTHLHSYGLSHGDLSLLNVQVTWSSDTIKLLDFGRSVAADSIFRSPDDEPTDPFAYLPSDKMNGRDKTAPPSSTPSVINGSVNGTKSSQRVEQIHPGTRPFSAPEVLRGECQDPLLADAYSFGMILVCLDRCEHVDVKPWDQRKDLLPKDLFNKCEVFEGRAREYLRKWNDGRRRLRKDDMIISAPGN
ncbi:kinase-like protein [Pluteus cervinus]|uniref:Kinase-like protein n=1 Tax=Pluteus cervinus TaxID=181527 RepID=A0ACD3AXX9_9AGAR|nr:kinase-like protein [Pluteus cervinus]